MACLLFGLFLCCCVLIFLATSASSSSSILRGVHPLDAKYFDGEVIKCKDGSNSFTKDRINDDFCDCFDGTDEPGTSACSTGKFYCRNMGSTPRFLFSSRVNDRICDCCDGSDEYDGVIYCPNTCIMGGNIEYKAEYHHASRYFNAIQVKESKQNGRLEDFVQNLKDLKVLASLQLFVIVCILAFWLFHHRIKSRRQRHH